MKARWIISGLVAAAGLQAGTAGMSMADNSQAFDALLDLIPGTEEEATLLQMSDVQLDSVVGGQIGLPFQTMGVSSADVISGQVNQIINQVLAAQKTNQPVFNTPESSTTAAQPSQTGTQANGPQPGVISSPPQSNNQVNSVIQAFNLSVTSQSDGTTKVVVQQGARTMTIIIPLLVPSQTLVNAIPFQTLVSVKQDVVHAIQELSGPMIGNPATMLRNNR
jgi:hypothetical protein